MYAHWKLRRIGLLSAVKIGCVVSSVIGFVTGIIWALIIMFFSSIISLMMTDQASSFGFSALIILPILFTILYAVLGTFFTFFFVLIFNLVAGLLGGLELDVDYTYIFKEK